MSSSDDDYVDIGEVTSHVDDECIVEVVTSEKSGNGRGKDIEWVEIVRFNDLGHMSSGLQFL